MCGKNQKTAQFIWTNFSLDPKKSKSRRKPKNKTGLPHQKGTKNMAEHERKDQCRFSVRILTETGGRPQSFIKEEIGHLLEESSHPLVVDPGTVSVSQAVQAPYEEPVTGVQASLISLSTPHQPDLTMREAAQELVVRWSKASACGMEKQSRLQLLNRDAFFTACVPSHRRCRLQSFRLGNFLNWGTFLEHYEEKILQDNGAMAEEIYVDFEHDKKQLIIKMKEDDEEYAREVGYKLLFSYSGIHSIVADVREGELCMYLLLRWPPQVFKKYPPLPREGGPLGGRRPPPTTVDLDKFYDWFRIVQFGGCTKEILGGCPAICLSWLIDDERGFKKFFEIVGRLKVRTKQTINFSPVKRVPFWSERPIRIPQSLTFPAYYALCGLLSRGYIVKDQILMCEREGSGGNMFMKKVEEASNRNPEAAERALDQLLAAIDERKNISLLRAFDFLFRVQTDTQMNITAADVGGALEPVDLPYNCVLVRKILVTPTRLVYLPCEVQMSNRVVREFGEECALRLGFRDDDGRKLMAHTFQPLRYRPDMDNNEGESILENMIRGTLCDGVKIGSRTYEFLAWSNSQMRDHGCYMYAKTGKRGKEEEEGVTEIRHWMGDFAAIHNVPKLMSRMGQCFTQAQVGLKLKEENWKVVEDVVGGNQNPEVEHKEEFYTFSDGIGRISVAASQKIAKKLELNPTPSAFQVRFGGCKGMLSVDPRLDAENQRNKTQIMAEFRDSMYKFQAIATNDLEIVKYSMQSPVFLNRPLIMILDQVSDRQGCGHRVRHRLHRLLENELFLMADMLCSERDSVIALKDRIPMSMDFPKLRLYGFSMTKEPFFRGLLLAVHRYNIKEQLGKAKVVIPNHLGRTVYGVMDETGILQYGQVFIQYSASIKKDKCQHKKIIHRGKIMVTKNPCIVPGDVRVFKAVDMELLHHHVDVIVFPQHGPRPHPDEMAGSDLDGDEYAVYFDQEMMFDHNEEAMTFPKSTPEEIPGGVQTEHMVDFFLKFMRQNTIGYVSNAHLVMCDQRGMFDQVCMDIARECSKAVDFPKTGNPAEPLTRDQQPYKYPDYFQKDNKPSYRSHRMLGQIFRKTKKVEEILELGSVSLSVEVDGDLEWEGWEEYNREERGRLTARATRDLYSSHLQSLMDTYGIADEASLVSGHMVTVRNRISEQEKEDFSFYNTEKLVELRYGKIFSQFRKEFFKEFGGEENVDLESPEEFVQQKASAWYMVTYGTRSLKDAVVTRCLSFPWIVWDILAYMKRNAVLERGMEEGYKLDPLREDLGRDIHLQFLTHPQRYTQIMEEIFKENEVVHRYCIRFVDLREVMAILVVWATKEGIFTRSPLRKDHVCMLLIMYGQGLLKEDTNDSKTVDDDDIDTNMNKIVNQAQSGVMYISERVDSVEEAEERNGKEGRPLRLDFLKGSFLLDFVKYCGMTAFRRLHHIHFSSLGSPARLVMKEWHLLNQVAFKTYHRIALMGNFEALYIGRDERERKEGGGEGGGWDVDEWEPIMIDLTDPREMANVKCDQEIAYILQRWSGCTEVRLARDSAGSKWEQVRILARGTLESRHKLRSYVTVDDLESFLESGKAPPEAEDF